MTRPRILRMAVLILGLLAALLAGAGIYQYAAAAIAVHAIAGQRNTLKQTTAYLSELARARADSVQVSKQVLQRKGQWSWSEQLPVMVTQISVIVEHSGAKIDTLQPSPAVERDGLTRFPLRLTLRTDLKQLTAVMQRLREAVPLLSVDHLAIRAGEKPGDSLQVEMTLTSYVIVNGQAAGGQP